MQDLTRRSALVIGGTLGLGALLAAPAEAATARTGPYLARQSGIGSRAAFARLTGSVVTARNAAGVQRLRLVKVADLGPTAQARSDSSFNLIFENTGSSAFVEGIYRVSASRLPIVSLLLTPVGPVAGGQQIQALINRGR